jgi:hypothetical protein
MATAPKQQDDKVRQQTMQIFNIAEKPIMEYISSFLEETPNTVFNSDIPTESDPLILLPIDDYKKDVYLKFTLKTIYPQQVKQTKQRAKFIEDVIEYKNVKEAIGFLVFCVKSVLPSIIASSMINNKPIINTDLVLNESNWSFDPVFKHELSIKKSFLEDSLSKITYMKQQKNGELPPEMVPELEKEFRNVVNSLQTITKQITDEIINTEKKINTSYINKPVLGICLKEITKSQLPKSKYEQKPQLPVLSSQSYEDPI